MADLQAITDQTVRALGYELVDIERLTRGLLRVTIDLLPETAAAVQAQAALTGVETPPSVTVHDCEKVSRQLSYVFEVEGIAYDRLEISSPGVDRPLKTFEHFVRFVGERAQVRLHEPFEGRRNFDGLLLEPEGNTLRLEFEGRDGQPACLNFTVEEVEKARLQMELDFRRNKR